jgi:hypothetical protein
MRRSENLQTTESADFRKSNFQKMDIQVQSIQSPSGSEWAAARKAKKDKESAPPYSI